MRYALGLNVTKEKEQKPRQRQRASGVNLVQLGSPVSVAEPVRAEETFYTSLHAATLDAVSKPAQLLWQSQCQQRLQRRPACQTSLLSCSTALANHQ